MSYILEALKRSQEERELGKVPTLASIPAPQAQRPGAGLGLWLAIALSLAALAIAVAAYVSLTRPDTPPTVQTGQTITPDAGTSRPVEPNPAAQSAPTKTDSEDNHPPVNTARPTTHPTGRQPAKPVVVAPNEAKPKPVTREPAPSPKPTIAPLPEPDDAVPSDLRADVDTFRKMVIQEQTGIEAASEKPAQRIATPTPPTVVSEQGATETKRPAGLHSLPSDVQARIPPHRISVHVYGADPARRFVILNAQRMREGESTGDGLLLKRILPDGVVLEYAGQRFFSGR